jgi:thymidylate synthase
MKQYLDMLRYILDNGELVTDGRTKEAYYSVFGYQTRYNLQEGFPAVTTKKLFFKGITHELLWFLKGDTNVKYLQENGVRIWDEWATKEQCAKFNRPEGELGPVYGHQWRNFGATNQNSHLTLDQKNELQKLCIEGCISPHTYEFFNNGFDQIAELISQIKKSPSSRRLIVSGWNPTEATQVALPPCHTLFQFKVNSKKQLSCQLYQRSADAALGVPFNIASYAMLTHMIAQVCDLDVGEFIHSIGDLHIYTNQIDGVKEQLTREPLPLPKLWLEPSIKNIDDFRYEHIKILDYVSHPKIEFPVAV